MPASASYTVLIECYNKISIVFGVKLKNRGTPLLLNNTMKKKSYNFFLLKKFLYIEYCAFLTNEINICIKGFAGNYVEEVYRSSKKMAEFVY